VQCANGHPVPSEGRFCSLCGVEVLPGAETVAVPVPQPSPVLPMVPGPQNGMGVAALVLGIIGIAICPVIFSILAIIFGSIGIQRANRGLATNRGVAVAGLVLGIIGVVLGVIVALLVVATGFLA
jgi:hypothetical protein